MGYRVAEQRVRLVERRDVELVVKGHMLDLWIVIPIHAQILRIAQRLHCLRHCHFRALGKQLRRICPSRRKVATPPLQPNHDHAMPARLRRRRISAKPLSRQSDS
jgi:hypothetical protein